MSIEFVLCRCGWFITHTVVRMWSCLLSLQCLIHLTNAVALAYCLYDWRIYVVQWTYEWTHVSWMRWRQRLGVYTLSRHARDNVTYAMELASPMTAPGNLSLWVTCAHLYVSRYFRIQSSVFKRPSSAIVSDRLTRPRQKSLNICPEPRKNTGRYDATWSNASR